MNEINTVRNYFVYNYGYSPFRSELLTFLTLGDMQLPEVTVSLGKDGPSFSCQSFNIHEWHRSNRPMMHKPPGMRTKIESPLKEKAVAVYERFKTYHIKSLLHQSKTRTYYEHRGDTCPLEFSVQLELFTEMHNINFDPDGNTLSDEITDAEYIKWDPEESNYRRARARYLDCLRHETKVAVRLGLKKEILKE